MKRIDQDISAGVFKPIYYLYGEETYLVKQYTEKLKNALSGGDTMNTAFFDEECKEAGAIIEYAQTFPFFAERRVVILKDVKLGKDEADRLAEYIQNPTETSVLIMIAKEGLDKRTKLYKAIDKTGYLIEFKTMDEATLRVWAKSRISKAGLTIQPADVAYFINRTGSDMNNISCELDKLISYCLFKGSVTIADIDEITVVDIKDKIFDLVDAVAVQNINICMREYEKLRKLMIPSPQIMAMIERHFTNLARVKALKKRGMQAKEIAFETRLHEFVVNKSLNQASKFSEEHIHHMMELCAQAEYEFKSGLYSDTLALEVLFSKLTNKDNAS